MIYFAKNFLPKNMPYLHTNQQEIYFEDSANHAPAIIFMHGFLLSSRMFDAIRDALLPNYRIISFDARTFGNSTWNGKAFNLYDTVADCVAIMDHLQIDNAVIAGMSQGGYAALRLALRFPERVKALILMSTRSGTDEEMVKDIYRQTSHTWKTYGAVAPMLEGLMGVIVGSAEDPKTKPFCEHWRPIWEKYSGESIEAAINNLIDRDEIDHLLPNITQAALVLHGKDDQGVPAVLGEKLHQNLPNSKKFVLTSGQHASVMTHPEEYIEPIKKFLGAL
jgi:pimeloyl-ACP methyl ester carboxylesterase